MKIEYIYEAGVFGSYKKTNAQSNIDNAKKDLAKGAQKSIIESKCDELAELYLDMLTEVNSQINAISIKYKYKPKSDHIKESCLFELSSYITMYYAMPRGKDMQINLIKNIYCNRPAIEYMKSHGCFILPLVDIKRSLPMFLCPEEIMSYKNMIKTVADAAEKVIKTHLSKFPSYTSIIPNNVKIVLVQDQFWYNTYQSSNVKQLFSYMGITDKGIDFEYPVGQGSSCLNHILDNYTILLNTFLFIDPTKSNEHIWKSLADPSPWMFNKIVFTRGNYNMSKLSADNFYGIKLLKFALDAGILISEKNDPCIHIFIDNTLKSMQSIYKLKQEILRNRLDKHVSYHFNDMHIYEDTFIKIGKKLTSKQAEKEGIFIDSLDRAVYEFDYNNTTEVEYAAKKIVDVFDKVLLTNADDITIQRIKQIAEAEVKNQLSELMSKILASKPNCISSSNKILLCDYYESPEANFNFNLRLVIDIGDGKIKLDKNDNLVFLIVVNFKLPIREVNPKHNKAVNQTSINACELIKRKLKIEIPLI